MTDSEFLDLNYLAGFIDGEGTFGITKVRNGMAGGRSRYMPYFAIVNTNLNILECIRDMYSSGRKIQPMKTTLGTKQCWNLRLEGKSMLRLVNDVLPFLIIKKREAELLLAFMGTMGGLHSPKQKLSDNMMVVRETYYIGLRAIKKNPDMVVNIPLLTDV